MILGRFGCGNDIIAPTQVVFIAFRPRFYFSVKMSFIQQIRIYRITDEAVKLLPPLTVTHPGNTSKGLLATGED